MTVKNNYKPNTRVRKVPYKALVEAADPDLRKPHVAYRFSRRTFKETDKSGVYD